jgi:glycosyltransferase involved in cell wall biosynthesis
MLARGAAEPVVPRYALKITKVLHVLPNHPAMQPGGAPETYALELHHAMLQSEGLEPILVGRTGAERHRAGSPFSSLDGDPSQYLVRIEEGGFDLFYMTYGEKSLYTRFFADFLRAQDPDVVHLQHSLYVGCELVSLVRRLLPSTPIVYTLHDYMPICHRDGRLVRTMDESLCLEPTPRRCHECFVESSEQDFFLRKRFIRAHLDHVDLFLAPSHFLLERYVDWGIPREKIRFEEYGRPPALPVTESRNDRRRNRLGFFGETSEFDFEGTEILLNAMRMVGERAPDAHLWLHGANERREQFSALLQEAGNVSFVGSWDRASLAGRMSNVDWVVVPSRWWEGSPLVIQDAFRYGRPVICGDVGGMAEKVAHEVNGLHFTVSNPPSLADTVCRAITAPGLWDELRNGIPPVYGMDDHVTSLTGIYRELLDRTARAPARVS